MNALFTAVVDIQALCVTQGWKCCAIGGVAVQRWGEPRQTRDVDLTLFTGLGQVIAELRPLLDLKEDREAEPRLLDLLRKHQ